VLPEYAQRGRQAEPRTRVPGFQAQRPAEPLHSLGRATQLQQRVPEGALTLGATGSEGRRLPEGIERLVPQPLLPERATQIAERLGVLRARRESGAEVRDRPRPLAAGGED